MNVLGERDDVLLRRAAKGDEIAFTELYRRHQASLYRYALRMTGSPWAAEEIVQDVFMTLIRQPKKYDADRSKFSPEDRAKFMGVTHGVGGALPLKMARGGKLDF